MIADILINPEQGIGHAKQSCCGCSGFGVGGEEFWMNTTARGIQLYRWDSDGVRRDYDLLPWSTVARFARGLPARLDLRTCRQELTCITLSPQPFPVQASHDERKRWEREEYRPWLARLQTVQARLEAALDAALADEGTQPPLFDAHAARPHSVTGRRAQPANRPATRARQEPLL